MTEFVDKDFKIYVVLSEDRVKEYTINELLPYGFKLEEENE